MYDELTSMSNNLSTRFPSRLRKTGPSLLESAKGLENPRAEEGNGPIVVVDVVAGKAGTAEALGDAKTESSLRVCRNPNAAILGWIVTPWRSVIRSRFKGSAANCPR